MRPPPLVIPGLADRLDELMHSIESDASPRNVMRVAEAQWIGGRAGRAVELLESLLADFPGSIAPRLLLGWCLEDCGRTEDGARVLEEARVLDPANPFLKREKRLAAAAPALQVPAQDEPPPRDAAAAVAERDEIEPPAASFAVPDFEREPGLELPAESAPPAIEPFLEPVLDLEAPPADAPAAPPVPRDPEREAEPEPALTLEELREIPPSPLYSATLGEIFEKQGFDEKAIEIYREVVRMHPERTDLVARIETLESRAAQEPGR